MNDNDVNVIIRNAISALDKINLMGYGSDGERKQRQSDAMHSVLIIIEQCRQIRERNLKGES